jgi:hypothetical protein
MLLDSVGERRQVTDMHKASCDHVEQEAALFGIDGGFFSIEGDRFQPVSVSLEAKSGFDPIGPRKDSEPLLDCNRSLTSKHFPEPKSPKWVRGFPSC